MRRIELITEAQELSLLEFYVAVIDMFKKDYDLTVTLEKSDGDYFVYVADYALDVIELKEDSVAKSLKKFWKKNYPYECEEVIEVFPTSFGYQVIMDYKEVEDTADEGVMMTEALIKPKSGESDEDFIARFMENDKAQKEFPDRKQRLSVAYSMLKEVYQLKYTGEMDEFERPLYKDIKTGKVFCDINMAEPYSDMADIHVLSGTEPSHRISKDKYQFVEASEETMKELDGLSDGLSVADIAKKHGVEEANIEEQLVMGVEVELEHTSDYDIAYKIAMDHLVEMPDYYTKLADMESSKGESEQVTEATKEDVELHTANQVLDNKFTWFFTITDSLGDIIEENIEDLGNAIDKLIKNDNASKIIASPYVDPDPDNPDVSLTLVENPGPIVLYDKEEEDSDESDMEGELS